MFADMLMIADLEDTLITETVRAIELPEQVIIRPSTIIEVDEFDPTMNLLDADVKHRFKTETIGSETTNLTAPVMNTATIFGKYSNVEMFEGDWVKVLPVNKIILAMPSNFGTKIYDKYKMPAKKIKKKKITNKPERKKQGTGLEFNSQLTFIMNVNADKYSADDIIPEEQDVLKFKVFRNGKIQLPGSKLIFIDIILEHVKYLESVFNATFHVNEFDLTKHINVFNVNVCMKNYKFNIKLNSETHIINCERLFNVIQKERHKSPLAIADVINNTSRNNISILFKTPTFSDKNKLLRLTVERSGKVNIKGGLYVEHSRQVFDFIDSIFANNHNIIIKKYKFNPNRFNVPQTKSDAEIITYWMGNNTILDAGHNIMGH